MRSLRELALTCVVLLASGCYGQPSLQSTPEQSAAAEGQESAADLAATVDGERQGQPSTDEGPGAQPQRLADLELLLQRLAGPTDSSDPASRDGGATWRGAELEKLGEICEACCRAGAATCTACLEPVAAASLPADELWPFLGKFLGVLRPRAAEGTATLGNSLLLRTDGSIRDRAFRIAVGSGAARRGQQDEQRRSASVIPPLPRAGERTVVVVENVSPCPELRGEFKGPDAAGRVDVLLESLCPEDIEVAEVDERGLPVAGRAVWAFEVAALPEAGLQVWLADSEEPVLSVEPAPRREDQRGD